DQRRRRAQRIAPPENDRGEQGRRAGQDQGPRPQRRRCVDHPRREVGGESFVERRGAAAVPSRAIRAATPESMEGCPMTYSTTYDEPTTFGGGDNEELIKLLIGRRPRRKRLRRLMLAKLIRDSGSEETDADEDFDDEEGGEEHRLAKILVGSAVRRRRMRMRVPAQMIRQSGAGGDA